MTPAQVYYLSGSHRQARESSKTSDAQRGTPADLLALAQMQRVG